MTKEQKKKWLNRAFYAKDKLKVLEFQLKRAKRAARAITPYYNKDIKGKSDGRKNGTYDIYMNLAEIEEKYNSYLVEYSAIRQEIQSAIDSLGEPELEAVLMYRFLDYLSLEEISTQTYQSRSTVIRRCNKGIEKLELNDIE